MVIGPDGRIEGQRPDDTSFTTVAPAAVTDTELLQRLRDADLEIDAHPPSGLGLGLLYFVPVPLLIKFWWWRRRRMGGGQLGQFANIGRSKAKAIADERPDVGFDDVAGYDGGPRERARDHLRPRARLDRSEAGSQATIGSHNEQEQTLNRAGADPQPTNCSPRWTASTRGPAWS